MRKERKRERRKEMKREMTREREIDRTRDKRRNRTMKMLVFQVLVMKSNKKKYQDYERL